ncbi:hypothetical protein KFV02_06350 [Desulfohalobiaceae bacterium Ax17]|uniref:hypothetical protein n=1 Tax=Desulfovulcanus ferrireducens TaxID=2831190 RepID=UPI00207BA55B|nr:hypothetical protein [Desulfovulcanus ferrireducens]MBT8763551.1 hypothetical protein [Desulfovulcanus ferrireducens]
MSRKTCQKISFSPEQRGLCSGGRVYDYLLGTIKLKASASKRRKIDTGRPNYIKFECPAKRSYKLPSRPVAFIPIYTI